MRGVWRLGSYPHEIWCVARFAADGPPAGATPVNADDGAALARGWSEHPVLRASLFDIAARLAPFDRVGPRTSWEELTTLLSGLAAEGAVRLYRMPVEDAGGKAPKKDDKKSDPPPPPEQKTWIAIRLVSDDPEPVPVPFKRYRIELPDHSTREGMLDANGMARVDGIDPGTCKVSFPDLHGPDWSTA